MNEQYNYDVFLSFAHQDSNAVHKIYKQLEGSGLKVFWANRELVAGMGFPRQIENALPRSQHFALYCSKYAIESEWVRKEWEIFLKNYHLKDKKNRLMYVLRTRNCPESDIPELLQGIHRPSSSKTLIQELLKGKIRQLDEVASTCENTVSDLERKKNKEVSELKANLKGETSKVEEARKYYQHNRFWSLTSENNDVHIFTCGRDVRHTKDSPRGYGGRTNIDMWDYRAVLDITHYFASNYPNARITIEDPISKLHDQDLKHAPHLADRIAHMRSMLENKDCIIVGSPDVSDFAEVVLAQIHGIDPYTEGRHKTCGFVVIKAEKYTNSSFYWQKTEDEQEGVAQILNQGEYEYFGHELADADGAAGKMHGILIVANNPFCRDGLRRRITILSGFSGVATNAIAKILTDESCLEEFFKLDNAYTNIDKDIEALIGVEYMIDRTFENRDSRRIKRVNFEKLVEL